MVDLINRINSKINSPEVKARDGKSQSGRGGGTEARPLGHEDGWASEEGASPVAGATTSVANPNITLSIASANIEAARFTLEDEESADRVLETTGALIRDNPAQARAAQANLPSQIVLSLFER